MILALSAAVVVGLANGARWLGLTHFGGVITDVVDLGDGLQDGFGAEDPGGIKCCQGKPGAKTIGTPPASCARLFTSAE